LILTLASTLRVVFAVYGAFWVVVVVATYLGSGALMKRADRALEKHGSGHSGSGH
jgi:hypothetical protein